MHERSSNSAGAIYLDSALLIEDLRRCALQAQERAPEIRRVVLFGSLVSGRATPRSDADILVIVDTSPHKHPRDRVPQLLSALSPLPCPADLFVLTTAEVDRYLKEDSPLLRIATTTGVDLLQPTNPGSDNPRCEDGSCGNKM